MGIAGASVAPRFEDLTSTGKVSSHYYTGEEMLRFQKPTKKKSLRKRDKLDLEALEAEARSAGLEQTLTAQKEVEEELVFDEDYLDKSLQRARKVALKIKDETPSGTQAIALLASSTSKNADAEKGVSQENQLVFTEIEEFVLGLNPDDVFMEKDVAPAVEGSGWAEVKDVIHDEQMAEEEEEVKPDDTIHESALGKGLSRVLQFLRERGTLKDTLEWGGRNMDKKKSKLVGRVNENDEKEIRIQRRDEYGRILTPRESFRLLSHKFHGKGPGKRKQEKRMRQYYEELKVKQMNNADTPSQFVKRMRVSQLQTKSPYLVLSGHV